MPETSILVNLICQIDFSLLISLLLVSYSSSYEVNELSQLIDWSDRKSFKVGRVFLNFSLGNT